MIYLNNWPYTQKGRWEDLSPHRIYVAAIKALLIGLTNVNNGMSEEKVGKSPYWCNKILAYLKNRRYIMNTDVRKLCSVGDDGGLDSDGTAQKRQTCEP